MTLLIASMVYWSYGECASNSWSWSSNKYCEASMDYRENEMDLRRCLKRNRDKTWDRAWRLCNRVGKV